MDGVEVHLGEVGHEEGRKKRMSGDSQVSGLSNWVHSAVLYREEKDWGCGGKKPLGGKGTVGKQSAGCTVERPGELVAVGVSIGYAGPELGPWAGGR